MKKLLPFFLLIASLSIFSQQVPDYYNDVNMNLTGTALKDALAIKIIGSHTSVLTYTPDVWNALKQTDIDPTDNTRVVLIYGWNDSDADITNDRTRGKDNHGSGSGVWNREHVYSKSLADPNLGTTGPGADAHNLRPCDAQRNSSRSNRKFAAGSGNSGITAQGNWYPGDEWKGDVARMMMYMYLRYGNQSLPTGVGVGNTVPTDMNMIDLFLQWNAEDPISDIEKQRNPVLEQMQGNRNPFVDNPAFATQIWGGPQAENLFGNGSGSSDTEAPTAPTDLVASNITQTTIDLNWTAATDNVAVYRYRVFKDNAQIEDTFNTNFTVTDLTPGTSYNLTVKAYDLAGNLSQSSNIVNITTIPGGSGGNTADLLISEYVEGSSYNKAIEIANFTGTPVNLADYSIQKATNGGGSWSNTLALTGTLNHGDVYVIVNNSASTELKSKANLNTTSSVMSFNGNDAVAIFKGSTLVDVIGDPNSSTAFAQDKTLQRKSSITAPNTTYLAAEWDVLSKDTFSGLGTHSVDGGNSDTEAPTAPSNLISSNLTQTSVDLAWTASTDNVGVTGYEVYQNDVKVTTVTTTSHNVTGLDVETAYNYSIKAIDAAGNISTLSNKVFITTLAAPDTEAPTSPTSLAVSNVTQTTADLAWTASTDNVAVTGYDVYQGSTVIATVTTTNYNVTGLTAATNYTFSVKAKDEAGNVSTASNTIGVTTTTAPDTEAPSAPSSLVVSNVTQTTADLAWTASTDNVAVTGYDVYQGNTVIATVTSTNYNVTGLTASTNYTFSVKAKDEAGNISSASNTIGVTTTTAPDTEAPTAPTSLAVSNVTQTTVDLAWTASTDNIAVTGYDVYQGNTVIATVTSTNYNVTGLTAATNYTFSVKAKDEAGNVSAASNTIGVTTATVPDTEAPTAPTSLAVSNVTQTTADLAWTASTDNIAVTGYDVYQGNTVIATVTSTNYNVTGLTAATNYTFSVKAKDEAGNVSIASNNVNVTTISGTGSTNELLISEYVEGTSYNKAIEIANFTGASVNLANYSIQKATNGGGAWDSTLALSGTLANGQVYVIVNNSASTALKAKANLNSTSSVMSFNGNDAVALFKGSTLIDVVGNPNISTTFGQDVTLQRKSSISTPNTTYTSSEWNVLANDTFSGLGTHLIDGFVDSEAPTVPINLIVSNVTETSANIAWSASTDNIAVTGYDIYQENTVIATVTSTNYNITGLTTNTTYTFFIKAKDEAGNTSLASNNVNITTNAIPTNTILSESYFESGWDNWTDGGNDCARYKGSLSYEGNYSIRIRDNSGVNSSMTSQAYDLSSYDTVEVEFYFYSYSMEPGEDFWLRYYDGNSWQTVETYVSGTDFENTNFYSATVTLNKTNYNFASNAQFRFQNDASGNADQIFIDQVTITGKIGTTSAKDIVASSKTTHIRYFDSGLELIEGDFKAYPNPVAGDILNIQLNDTEAENVTYTISSMLGKIITRGNLTDDYINVNNLNTGIYLLEINDGEEKMVQKFIKK